MENKKNVIITACVLCSLNIFSQTKPNIIFIITDQQRSDAIGCSGNNNIITPNIDSLAQDGYLFCNAYSSTPSSTPARTGLLTGMSPWHHGMLGYGKVAEHYKYELPQMLKDNGFITLGIGKMHWTPQNVLHGYMATILDESGRVELPYFISDYRKWFQTQAPGENPDKTGLGWNDHSANEYQLPEKLHPTKWTGDIAVGVIENYNKEKPLFMKISFARPHSPYDPPKRILEKYNKIEMKGPSIGDWSKDIGKDNTNPKHVRNAAFAQYGEEYVKNTKKHYYASISFIDEQVGRIVKALKERDMYDNTIICFTSDHGDMMGDHNHWRKTYAYEGSSSIPFIIKTSNNINVVKSKGTKIEEPVELRDFLPTFLDAIGSKIPESIDGMSVLSLLRGNVKWRKWIDLEHSVSYNKNNYWVALTDGKIKLIHFLRTGKEQLFDLKKDPYELVNLIDDISYKSILEDIRKDLIEHLRERGDKWVKDDKIIIRTQNMLYSPNYPNAK